MKSGLTRMHAGVLCLSATLLAGPGAFAQTQQQVDRCNRKGGTTLEQQIAACTTIIESGKYGGTNLAILLNNRGAAFNGTRQYERALSDYDQAAKLTPRDAVIYFNRAGVHYLQGQHASAIRDLDEAIRLNPAYAKAFHYRSLSRAKIGDQAGADADRSKAENLDPSLGR